MAVSFHHLVTLDVVVRSIFQYQREREDTRSLDLDDNLGMPVGYERLSMLLDQKKREANPKADLPVLLLRENVFPVDMPRSDIQTKDHQPI